MSVKKYDMIISTGGTGGHIFPALAVANEVLKKRPETSILFVGSKFKMEMQVVPQAGFDIVGLPMRGIERNNVLKNLALPFLLMRSMFICFKILRKNPIKMVIGFGGFASFCMMKVAQWLGKPTCIHEQNSFAGITNKIVAKNAEKIFTGFEHMNTFFPATKIIFTGNPIRESIRQQKTKDLSKNTKRNSILIVGGSLGAESINQFIAQHMTWFSKNNTPLFWQTGKANFSKYQSLHNPKKGIHVLDYLTNIEEYYHKAGIIVSRSGAMAIAELSVVAKPVVFIPLPTAAENHQLFNANYLKEKNACLVVEQKNLNTDFFIALEKLISNSDLRKSLSENLDKLKMTDAHTRITNHLLTYFN